MKLKDLKHIYSGKVRDLYEIDDKTMIMVATDRLSAFDVIMDEPVPGKGELLTAISLFWFDKLKDVMPNHLTGKTVHDYLDKEDADAIAKRSVVVKKLNPLKCEAIVRGYIIGGGWAEYQKTGSICGIELPKGMKQAQKFPAPIFTPSTKADVGGHDINISFEKCQEILGKDIAIKVRDKSIELYTKAAEYALGRGIIIADTKFEFGLDENGEVVLMDEVLTPDSSRFWPKDEWKEDSNPPSFDKQFVRDYLNSTGWDHTPPAPKIPEEVIKKTLAKYQEAYDLLTK